jgi:hypothetical protein
MRFYLQLLKSFAIIAGVFAVGCNGGIKGDDAEAPATAGGPTAGSIVTLDQGWSADTQQRFWFTDQGSQILPYSWFLALEQAGSESAFRTDANIEHLGYFPERPSKYNPDGLPIGFAKTRDPASGEDWMGPTCAACHTGQVKYRGKIIRVDGAPTLGDFTALLDDLVAALRATAGDEAKFQRFAAQVTGSQQAIAELRRDLNAHVEALADRITLNLAPSPPGHGRVDAIGNIFNEAFVRVLGIAENKVPPSAPVSYPFIWDTPQHDVVQWNGSAPNAGIGSLLRNIGEVLGVFGNVTVSGSPLPKGFKSSIKVTNLGKLEGWLQNLWSPRWPVTLLTPIDTGKAERGNVHYQHYCLSCHAPIERADRKRRVNAVMTRLADVGTDPAMATNAVQRTAMTGVLQGIREMILIGDRLGAVAPGIKVGPVIAAGVALGQPVQAIEAGFGEYLKVRKATPFDALSYKARPLNGIWATAPYLHNGSVPSLWQLLQPSSRRDQVFHVGSYEFDPLHVGFASGPDTRGSRFDTRLPGNSNSGHDYGVTLGDSQKWELLEYLKTL